MVQEKYKHYKIEIFGLNQASYSNNLLLEFKRFLRNNLEVKFSDLEYNPETQVTSIFFQFEGDYVISQHIFSKKIHWRSFIFSMNAKALVKKSPSWAGAPHKNKNDTGGLALAEETDKKSFSKDNNNCENNGVSVGSGGAVDSAGPGGLDAPSVLEPTEKSQRDIILDDFLSETFPLLSVDYQNQLKTKRDHILETYSTLFKQYLNFKQLNTFQTFMRTKFGESRPFLFSDVVGCPCSSEDAVNKLELSVGTDIETKEICVGFPVNDDPNSNEPCQVIPLRDVYNKHCFNIPKKFCIATEIIEKIVRRSGLKISSNKGNPMGVWYKITYRIHNKTTGLGTPAEHTSPHLMIIFHIRPGYKLTPEIIDYISDVILDEILNEVTVRHLSLASVYIQRNHPVPFNKRTENDEYLKVLEDFWKYMPEWYRLWGVDSLEDSDMKMKIFPFSEAPPHLHDFNVKTNALREMLIDITNSYTVVDINCNTGILAGSLVNKCSQMKLITFNIHTKKDIENHLSLLGVRNSEVIAYKKSRTHYNPEACDHGADGQCIQCAIHRHAQPGYVHVPEDAKINVVSKVLDGVQEKIACIYHYNSDDDFCDDFFKLIQYNTKIEKVVFVTNSGHNLNSNQIVQCIPYVMTHVYCVDNKPNSSCYDAFILFERLEPNMSHDNVQLGAKFNEKTNAIERMAQETKLSKEKALAAREEMIAQRKLNGDSGGGNGAPSGGGGGEPLGNHAVATRVEEKIGGEAPVEGEVGVQIGGTAVVATAAAPGTDVKDARYQRFPTYPPPPSFVSPRQSLVPPTGGSMRFPPYGPPPPSPFIPRGMPPSRLPPPPSFHQSRQRFGPPDIYGNPHQLFPPTDMKHHPVGSFGPPDMKNSIPFGPPDVKYQSRPPPPILNPPPAVHSQKSAPDPYRFYPYTNDDHLSNKRKTNEPEPNSKYSENDFRNKKLKVDNPTSYQSSQTRFDYSTYSNKDNPVPAYPGSGRGGPSDKTSQRAGTSSPHTQSQSPYGSFSHSSATQTGFQPYSKNSPTKFQPPAVSGGGNIPSSSPLNIGLPPLPAPPRQPFNYQNQFSMPPSAHSDNSNKSDSAYGSISDLTQKKSDYSSSGKDSKRSSNAPSPIVNRTPPNPNPSPKPSHPNLPVHNSPSAFNINSAYLPQLSSHVSAPGASDKAKLTSAFSSQPPLPPNVPLSDPKYGDKPPLPTEPPPDTKENVPVQSSSSVSETQSKSVAMPDSLAVNSHASVPSYSQMSHADILKIYEAQMLAYTGQMPGADINQIYAMQVAEAQMLQAAQAAQMTNAQKLYAAQIASIEEQQKQYALQIAHAQKLQSEKALADAQMLREAQLKAQQKQAAAAAAEAQKLNDAQKLQMINEQKMQMYNADVRKLYEDQLLYAHAQAQNQSLHSLALQQQAAALHGSLGYQPSSMYESMLGQGYPQQRPRMPVVPMHVYPSPGGYSSSPLLYNQSSPAGFLHFESLPRPR